MSTPQLLLERYVEAKDLVRPQLMREIFAPDAVLTFSIATDSIDFPRRVAGIDHITKTLIVDFAVKYSRCKTFYVCESPPKKTDKTAILPWLVLMRESALARLRSGKGYYEWTFERRSEGEIQVVALHIHIAAMDAIEDADGRLLNAAQAPLTYPWLRPPLMRSKLRALAEADPAFAFLSGLAVPVDPAMCGEPLPPPALR
jgi:hypothetical protein